MACGAFLYFPDHLSLSPERYIGKEWQILRSHGFVFRINLTLHVVERDESESLNRINSRDTLKMRIHRELAIVQFIRRVC